MIRLSKLNGLANDFLVLLGDPVSLPDDFAAAVCARRTGIGADGLILGRSPTHAEADVAMVLLNADGSEAEVSGNGLRCLAQEVLRSSGRSEGAVVVETLSGLRAVRTVRGEPSSELVTRVDFGHAGDGPGILRTAEAVPARHRISVDVGNPHVVLVTDTPGALAIADIGPQVESGYPAGVNVHAAAVVDDDEIAVAVWERGVGVTQACGSGAVATTWALHQLGLVGSHVTVHMPGGSVEVVVGDDGSLSLIGPSVFVGTIEVADWLVQ
jgi:diaminopimelate epimerase